MYLIVNLIGIVVLTNYLYTNKFVVYDLFPSPLSNVFKVSSMDNKVVTD